MPKMSELPDAAEFGARLKKAMAANGYGERGGAAALAKKYQVKPPVVTAWTQGLHLPSLAKVRRMAKDWGIALDWLYWGEGQEPTWPERPRAGEPSGKPAPASDVEALKVAIVVIAGAMVSARQAVAAQVHAALSSQLEQPENSDLQGNEFLQKLAGILAKSKSKQASRSNPQ